MKKISVFMLSIILVISVVGVSFGYANSESDATESNEAIALALLMEAVPDNAASEPDVIEPDEVLESELFTEKELEKAVEVPLVNGIKAKEIERADGRTMVLNADDFSEIRTLGYWIGQLLKDPSVSHVIALYEDDNEHIAPVTTLSVSLLPWRVKNVKTLSYGLSSNPIAITSGQPDITIGTAKTSSIPSSYAASFGVAASVVSASVGFRVTGSTSMTYSGTWTIPSKHNGKSVKKGYLEARTIYLRKSYDIYRLSTRQGTGTAKKAKGVDFSKSYTYK
ncbi:MAG: hypothetical protein LBT52_00300 [Clostridiales Family XIII bacterium]|jgi:hypothetical protein|nr:hypothetical protein [Clostridiales Family XIII bacterium]